MSRHKIVKNLSLEDELDDYDGGEGYDYEAGVDGEQELSPEDQRQMREGTLAVREILAPGGADITDRQIQEALWHYYYDVGKTVVYLTGQERPQEGSTTEKKKKKKKKSEKDGELQVFLTASKFVVVLRSAGESWMCGNGVRRELSMPPVQMGLLWTTCSSFTIPPNFWNDMPWLKVPLDRQTIFTEPPCLRGGLMGGSESAPKMSKLQALAAARKKKAQEQKNEAAVDVEKPMSGLVMGESSQKGSGGSSVSTSKESQKYPARKRKNSSPHKQLSQPTEPIESQTMEIVEERPLAASIQQAKPSAFATTMFSSTSTAMSRQPSTSFFTLPYVTGSTVQSTDAFAGPSPDDVVTAAQSKAASLKAAKGPPKTAGEKKADQIANGVEAMKIDDSPKPRSKNLDVLKEYEKKAAKNAANFVVIGHVDAGKSTLMGRLLYDLKVVDQRTIDKYRKDAEKIGKSSFALAWVLDQGTEERSRGVTIDIATNKFETEKTAFTILDAPGHRDFIPNMIAGASQADFAVLVIDASTGSFESGLRGQTKEHALLVRSMGVQRLIVAINKLDTVNWSQDRFTEIEQQVSAFLTAAGFLSKNISFVPVSGLQGDNIVRRSAEPAAVWYTGPTLIEELDSSEPIARALNKPLRFTIGDIFRGGVQNPLSVSGRIEAGSLQMGDALLAQPSGQKCFIKGLEIDNEASDWAVAGQNVTIHLSDIDQVHLKVGDVLCSPASPIQAVTKLTIKVLAFEFLMPMSVDIHRGRLNVPGNIVELAATLDKGSGKVVKKKPRVVKPASVARIVIEVAKEVPLEVGQRVVLRCNGETVAAGLLE